MKKKTGEGPERVVKNGKRYYRKKDRTPVPVRPLFDVLTRTAAALVAKGGDDEPSVTTILGVLAKPALISWAAREERKMVAAMAGRLYKQLNAISAEPVEEGKFVEMLLAEAGKPANTRLLEKAANVGTEVHARIEWEFKGELGREREVEPPALTTEQSQRAFDRWQEWREQVKLKPIDMELGLYSSIFGYGGTLDLLAEITIPLHMVSTLTGEVLVDGQALKPGEQYNVVPEKTLRVVIDFKTGKRVYEEAFLQNVAYRMALAEMGIETDGGVIVRLPKYPEDPLFDAVNVPKDEMLAPVFLCCRLAYNWVSKHEQKRSYKKKVDAPATTSVESERPEDK